MANLLECLLQIKGLRETPERLKALVASADDARWRVSADASLPEPIHLLAQLAEIEFVHGAALRMMLASAGATVPLVDGRALLSVARRHDWTSAVALERFNERRRDNLELLDRCSADDLSRTGDHPHRRNLTVADLVAVMLAMDTEHVGDIRRGLGS